MPKARKIRVATDGRGHTCPFTVQIDSAEQQPYRFLGLRTNADAGNLPLIVPIERKRLITGDYSIIGMHDKIVVERKSKSDFFGSVARRENFEDRLGRMEGIISAGGYACVVVEAHYMDCLLNPPPYSQLNPKALSRTIISWDQRYRASWWFIDGRQHAESLTFRILERFFANHQDRSCNPIPSKPGNSSAR